VGRKTFAEKERKKGRTPAKPVAGSDLSLDSDARFEWRWGGMRGGDEDKVGPATWTNSTQM
jgi:hypothetical protein